MPLIQTAAPATEPIELYEAKAHLRVDDYQEDALITALIAGARTDAETICRRALITQSWKLVLDRFPSPGMASNASSLYGVFGISPGPITTTRNDQSTGYEIIPGVPTLQSVESIKYIDLDGAQQTLDPALYKVDVASALGRIVPAYGTSWPASRCEINAVEVSFTSGYGDASKVPAGIKNWMLIRLGTLYANRESVAILTRGKVEALPYVDRLLDPYRIVSY